MLEYIPAYLLFFAMDAWLGASGKEPRAPDLQLTILFLCLISHAHFVSCIHACLGNQGIDVHCQVLGKCHVCIASMNHGYCRQLCMCGSAECVCMTSVRCQSFFHSSCLSSSHVAVLYCQQPTAEHKSSFEQCLHTAAEALKKCTHCHQVLSEVL